MSDKNEIQILNKVKKAKRGTLFFAENFISTGDNEAVRKALQRLTDSGALKRVTTGMYVRPEKDPVLGFVLPGVEDIANALAKRDKARIVPTGVYALNRIGLSTQVPLNVVYLTDGTARKIIIGKQIITFKKTSPKNLAAIGDISKLVIQALRTIGKDKITEEEKKKILTLLKKEKINHFEHDLRLAPVWIRQIMKEAINNKKYE